MSHTEALQRALQHATAIKQALDFSYGWLARKNIDAAWVRGLDDITTRRRILLPLRLISRLSGGQIAAPLVSSGW